MNVKPDQYTSW